MTPAKTAPEWFGERVLAAAEAVARQPPRRSSGVLRAMADALAESLADGGLGERDRAAILVQPEPSATSLFGGLSNLPRVGLAEPKSRPAGFPQVLARPGEPRGDVRPMPGDILLRVARGENWGLVAIVASPGLARREELADRGWRGEGYPLLLPGQYVHVLEPGGAHPRAEDRFARRLANAADLVLSDTMLLRIPAPSAEAEGEATTPANPAPPTPGAPSAVERARVRRCAAPGRQRRAGAPRPAGAEPRPCRHGRAVPARPARLPAAGGRQVRRAHGNRHRRVPATDLRQPRAMGRQHRPGDPGPARPPGPGPARAPSRAAVCVARRTAGPGARPRPRTRQPRDSDSETFAIEEELPSPPQPHPLLRRGAQGPAVSESAARSS